MLRSTWFSLGRWSSRDFLRGRSKRAGAVHTRHTHGRQGRYKRLSSLYSSVRDGRRHANNHMHGGLGVKLGGGLFGLRIPRQHQLSHMTKEEFELEVYGHPNITNPYREHLDAHPDLESVMLNATVTMQVVALLPKVPRGAVPPQGTLAPVPADWSAVVRDIGAALDALTHGSTIDSERVQVHLTTLEASVCCSRVAETKGSSVASYLETGAALLYQTHCRLGHQMKLESPQRSSSLPSRPSRSSRITSRDAASPTDVQHRRSRRPTAFMGAALRAPTLCSSAFLSSITKQSPNATVTGRTTDSLAALPCDGAGRTRSGARMTAPTGSLSTDASPSTCDEGMAKLVRQCGTTGQPLLRLCLRPTLRSTDFEREASTPFGICAASSPSLRRVLKAERDPNSEVGVWRSPRSPLADLLRWNYNAHDPRAHCHDALPHHRRLLPVLLFVDYSTMKVDTRTWTTKSYPPTLAPLRPPPATLVPRHLSLEMEATGFKLLSETSLGEVAEALKKWRPAWQWEHYQRETAAAASPHIAP